MIGIVDLKVIGLLPIISVIATFHPMSGAKIAGENTEKSICFAMGTTNKLLHYLQQVVFVLWVIYMFACLFVLPMFNVLLFRIDTKRRISSKRAWNDCDTVSNAKIRMHCIKGDYSYSGRI